MAARKKSEKKTKRISAKQSGSPKRKALKQGVVKRASAKALVQRMAKASPISVGNKPFTKSEFIATLVDQTGIAKKEVLSLLDTISRVISAHLHKQGPEVFAWPGMFKMKVVKKPPSKARPGVNPFTGEAIMIKAKPASRRVKILALKQLKEMVR